MTTLRIPLPNLPRTLVERGYVPAQKYSAIYRAVLDARIPATQEIGTNRWIIQDRDIPAVAAALGLNTIAD